MLPNLFCTLDAPNSITLMIDSEFQRDKDCGKKKGKGTQKEKWKGEENFQFFKLRFVINQSNQCT